MNDQTEGDEKTMNTSGEVEQSSTNNTDSTAADGNHKNHKKGGIHSNALFAASMGRAATAHVDPHSTSGLAQTGTNLSYEGATAPGGGGSAGSGYTTNQTGVESNPVINADITQIPAEKTETAQQEAEDDADAKNTLT